MGAALFLFIGLALLLLLLSLHSLREGRVFVRLFREARDPPSAEALPPAALILPFRGLDPDLESNLEAYFRLEGHDLRILLVTEDREDASVPLLERVRARFPEVRSRLLFAGPCRGRSQKVHNLLHAVENVDPRVRVLAFGDSDIRPGREWLVRLAAPLADPEVGVATGFRWYVPESGNFASVLRSVWNAGVATLLARPKPPFAWGGAMAIRRATFERCGVAARWRGALSDDYALSRAVREEGLSIRFVPGALGFSHEDCTLRELLAWSRRQLAITRVYRPALWRVALASETFSNLVLWGGAALVPLGLLAGEAAQALLLAAILFLAYAVRGAKGWLRLEAIRHRFPREWRDLRRWRAGYVLWGPLSSLVTLIAASRAIFGREIVWRGIRYRMVSPSETVVLES